MSARGLLGALGALVVALASPAARGQDFTYMPPGELVSGSGTGTSDATVYAPGMRFPIEQAPAYANSQVWGYGGSQGPGGGQCDEGNFSYPWWDNYCETRSWDMPLCPAGTGHQGQDIRGATCDKDVHWVVAAQDGTITNVGSYSVYLTAADGTRFDYLHMSNVQVGVGQQVTRGQHLGMVSNEFGGTPTTVHLHFNIRQLVDGVGTVYVPTYMSLVTSYEELLGPVGGPVDGALDAATCAAISGWVALTDEPDEVVEAKLYFDGGPEADGAQAIGHPVVADQPGDDSCEAIGSCDHGFVVGPPLSLFDGDEHVVRAFGHSLLAGAAPELAGSPRDFSCTLELGPEPRRPVGDDAQVNWRFSAFWDIASAAHLAGGEAALLDKPEGPALDDFPRLVVAQADATLWLIDAGYRRAVDPASARAWDLSPLLAEQWSLAELEAIPEGAPLPARPIVLRDEGGVLFLIDDPSPKSGELPASDPPPSLVPAPEADDGCGCRAVGSGEPVGASLLSAVLVGLLGLRRRRDRSRS